MSAEVTVNKCYKKIDTNEVILDFLHSVIPAKLESLLLIMKNKTPINNAFTNCACMFKPPVSDTNMLTFENKFVTWSRFIAIHNTITITIDFASF